MAKSASKQAKNDKKQTEVVKLKQLTIDLDKQIKLWCEEEEVIMREYVVGLIEKDMRRKKK